MTYELAKQLKDAGFPQKEPNDFVIQSSGRPGLKDGHAVKVYLPTLSELIEACGDDFYSLEKANDNNWEAWGWRPDRHSVFSHETKTPEEAVAKLWLALNASPKDSLT